VRGGSCEAPLTLRIAACAHKQVIEETHAFYNKLKSGKRANSEELSLI
jgi:hypothetical protein